MGNTDCTSVSLACMYSFLFLLLENSALDFSCCVLKLTSAQRVNSSSCMYPSNLGLPYWSALSCSIEFSYLFASLLQKTKFFWGAHHAACGISLVPNQGLSSCGPGTEDRPGNENAELNPLDHEGTPKHKFFKGEKKLSSTVYIFAWHGD